MEEEEGRKETCATEGASERGFPTRTRIALAGPIQDDDTLSPLSQASLFKQEGRKWVFVKQVKGRAGCLTAALPE